MTNLSVGTLKYNIIQVHGFVVKKANESSNKSYYDGSPVHDAGDNRWWQRMKYRHNTKQQYDQANHHLHRLWNK